MLDYMVHDQYFLGATERSIVKNDHEFVKYLGYVVREYFVGYCRATIALSFSSRTLLRGGAGTEWSLSSETTFLRWSNAALIQTQ